MLLRQLGFTYSAFGPFTKNKERIQKLKKTEDRKYISRNELDRACFLRDMAYGNFKDLARRTAFDKVLRHKAFNALKIQYMMDIKYVLLLWLISILLKSLKVVVLIMNLNKASNQLKNYTNQSKKRKVYSSFKENICAADSANMQLISKFNKGPRFLLCDIDIFSK